MIKLTLLSFTVILCVGCDINPCQDLACKPSAVSNCFCDPRAVMTRQVDGTYLCTCPRQAK